MAKTLSTMLDLGTTAPDFTLPDVVSGKPMALGDFTGQQGAARNVHLSPLSVRQAYRKRTRRGWDRITRTRVWRSSRSAPTTPRTIQTMRLRV